MRASDSIYLKDAENWLFSNFPRLFDLYQRSDKDNPNNYFNFNELFPWTAEGFIEIEKVLKRLDPESWNELRTKALPYVTADNPTRRYQQLFSILDEARGYALLVDQGYEQISFLKPETNKKVIAHSPDLVATKVGSIAILEVKTINESDDNLDPEAPWQREAVTVPRNLSEKFKNKLISTIKQARDQLNSYPYRVDRKIVFLVVRLDHGQKTGWHLYTELKNFIATQTMKEGVEVYHVARL